MKSGNISYIRISLVNLKIFVKLQHLSWSKKLFLSSSKPLSWSNLNTYPKKSSQCLPCTFKTFLNITPLPPHPSTHLPYHTKSNHTKPYQTTWVTIFNYSASKVNGIFVSRGKITGRIRKNLLVFSNFSTFLPLFPHFCQNFAYFSTCTLKILSWKV